MTATQIQIILEIFIFLIGLYLAFFKSYFTEKGKNVATKEDIEEITEKVERIKNQIAYSTQSRLNLNSEKRNAIVNCFEKYNYWQNIIVETDVANIQERDRTKFFEFENKMDDAYFHFQLSHARMILFLEDIEMTKSISSLKVKTMELQHIVERHLDKMSEWITQWGKTIAYTGMIDTRDASEKLIQEKSDLLKAFYEEKMEKYKEVLDFTGEFQLNAYKHIQSLTKQED